MISLDEPLPEGIVRILDDGASLDIDLSQETSGITCIREEEGNSLPLNLTYIPIESPHFFEWVVIAASRISKSLITALAATQLNIARLSSDHQWTAAFDPSMIIKAISEEKISIVSVSPGLIMPRTQVRVSSLLAPSGAYLAWMEMLRENSDNENR
jgi:hypothetical protein